MNAFECEIYIFGECRTIILHTEHTLEELKKDWDLRGQLVMKALEDSMSIQQHLEQI